MQLGSPPGATGFSLLARHTSRHATNTLSSAHARTLTQTSSRHSRTLFRTPLCTHLREAGFKGGETRPVGHPFACAFIPLDRALILGGRRRGAAAAGLSVGSISLRTATACSRVSFIYLWQLMDRILTPVGGAIVLMSDDLKYPIDYRDRALEIVRCAVQSIREHVVIGQEGYVLSEAAMGSKWSCEGGCQDNSELNGKLVHVLRLGIIVIPAPSDHDYMFQSFLGQTLKIILNYRPHMRHVAFAHLAETNDVPLLMIIPPSSTSFDSGESQSQWQLQDWQPLDALFRTLASNFGVLPHWNLVANRHSPWQPNSSAWIGWLEKSYRSAEFSPQLANVPI